MISPIVITSKKAADHLADIKTQHATLVEGMATHSLKVAAYKQTKQAELQAQQTVKMQLDKEKAVADTQAKKDADTFALKQMELDIKKSALSAV